MTSHIVINTNTTKDYIPNLNYSSWDYKKQNRYDAAKKCETKKLSEFSVIDINSYRDIILLLKSDIDNLINKMNSYATNKDLYLIKRWTFAYEILSWRVKYLDYVYYLDMLKHLQNYNNYIIQW